jgi:hypothetical protein
MRRTQQALMVMLVALVMPLGAVFSQDELDTQLATAIQHAGFAMGAEELGMAVRHLGHVLNCIVGEGGEGFGADWGHPCGDQGSGIAVDLEAHAQYPDVIVLVDAARALAQEGVAQESLGAVHAAAAGVRALLEALQAFGG